MKKLLLSSIIMFGICGFVTAQNAPSKSKKAETSANSATPTPQKAAVAPVAATTDDVNAARPASDKNKSAAVPAATDKSAKVKPAQAAVVSADGVVITAPDAAKDKAAAAKANELKKTKDN